VAHRASRRRYEDGCAAAHALELVGERWALLVVRELILGPKRFTDLREGLPGISANVLTDRLAELEASAILRRRRLPPPVSAWVYELTEWGQELEPLIREIGRWAARSPSKRADLPMGATSLILSFRTMFSAERAKRLRGSIGLRLGAAEFRGHIAGGVLEIGPGAASGADVVLAGDPNIIAAVVYGGASLEDALAAGLLRAEGDLALLRRFVTLFPLPETAPAATTPSSHER
jgi:DNA-binding HxlR family transcriptional regulator